MKRLIQIIGVLFILGGAVHWLIILGIMNEISPLIITLYFHSLAVLSPLAGYGLIIMKHWGRKLGMFIAATQIPAHLVMIYLDIFRSWNSEVASWERMVDLSFALFYIIFFNSNSVCKQFKK